MTISTTAADVTLQGNGATVNWPFAFRIPGATATDQANAAVVVVDTTVSPPTSTVIGTGAYTISGVSTPAVPSNAGEVVYPLAGPALAAGQYISIQRVLPYLQSTAIPNQSNFYGNVVEAALDYLTMLAQQLRAQSVRCLKLAASDPGVSFADMPLKSTLANRSLNFNAVGDPVAGAPAFPAALTALFFPRVDLTGAGYELISPTATRTAIGAQPVDATLTALAALVSAADQMIYATGVDAFAMTAITALGRQLLARATSALMRGDLGVVIGTDVQAYSAVLAALAALAPAADKLPYFTGAAAGALTTLTAFARTLIAGVDAAAMRTTLGLVSGGAGDVWVRRAGDTMTGPLVLSGDAVAVLNPVSLQQMNAALVGIAKRGDARAASVANVNLAAAPALLDGQAMIAGQRYLIKNQAAPADNGLYDFNGLAVAMTRSATYDTFDEIAGATITVEAGTVNAGTFWWCSANDGGTIGVTALPWTSFYPGAGGTVTNITASNGAKVTGGGAIVTTGNIEADIAGLAADATPDLTADYLMTYDASAGVNKKVLLSKISPLEATTKMLFVQTAAPTGWTKITTSNDTALRMVSGIAGTGGTANFTSAFASRTPTGSITVDNHTLTSAEMPSHTHTNTTNLNGGSADGGAGGITGSTTAAGLASNWVTMANAGSGGAHNHTGSFTGVAMDFAVKYVDVIQASKD